MSNKCWVVGGAGYIGSHLVPVLIEDGWDVEVIDAGVYGNVPPAQKQDVRELDPPADGAPVVWLATLHREPEGFKELSEEEQQRWTAEMEALMVELPRRWHAAGHPIVYPSSMQVLGLMGASAYGWAKRLFEASMVGERGVQILRFGTVWGGLDKEPARVETAINAALVGKKLTEDYLAFTTHIHRVVESLSYALCRNYLGAVENVIDREDPTTGSAVNSAMDRPIQRRGVWDLLFTKEFERAQKKWKARPHMTAQLADYYHLPWPEGTPKEWNPKAPVVPKKEKNDA